MTQNISNILDYSQLCFIKEIESYFCGLNLKNKKYTSIISKDERNYIKQFIHRRKSDYGYYDYVTGLEDLSKKKIYLKIEDIYNRFVCDCLQDIDLQFIEIWRAYYKFKYKENTKNIFKIPSDFTNILINYFFEHYSIIN